MANASWGPGYPSCQPSKIKSDFSVDGTRFPGGIRYELVELVTRLVRECKRRGYRFGTASDPSYGCWGYSCRAISGTRVPSNHSWGLAVDINAPTNPYTYPLRTDMPSWMPDLWNAYGFRWGGDYNGRKDAMHYEFMGSVAEAASYTQRAIANNLGGSGTPSPPQPTPPEPTPTPTPPYKPGVFPLPSGYYYGPKNGPTESISGMAGEPQPWIDGLKDAQRHLQQHIPGSLPKYGADGKYGETLSGETYTATVQFQKMKGLAADGLIGPSTFSALMKAPSGTPPKPPAVAPPFPLPSGYYYGPLEGPKESISGMAGEPQSWIDGLKTAQARLNVHLQGSGKAPIGVDGKYGPQTEGATRWYQEARHGAPYNLSVDGLIGSKTWTSLWQ